ncbi:hypothetical protein HanRHA438_Chr09g0422651 [Helianthus annuus]|nr:hypothetical protein HanRHA438_Chr09g0422651 [Helianthus annuus]
MMEALGLTLFHSTPLFFIFFYHLPKIPQVNPFEPKPFHFLTQNNTFYPPKPFLFLTPFFSNNVRFSYDFFQKKKSIFLYFDETK